MVRIYITNFKQNIYSLFIEMANDVNIWEEERNENTFQTEIENGDTLVTAATLNQLVLKATDEDKYGIKQFIKYIDVVRYSGSY